MIEFCRSTNRWCHFERTDFRPPTPFPADRFDLIYAFSVFSHLSEPVHEAWLGELSRILRPGGLLVVTTREREFIESPHPCERIRGWTRTIRASR
jgi:SAM-dependent methyltransferase